MNINNNTDQQKRRLLSIYTPESANFAYVYIKQRDFQNNCFFKTVLGGIAGFGFGAFFGLIRVSFDTSPIVNENQQPLPFRQQMKHILKDTGKITYSTAKSLGMVAAIYAPVECMMEGYRAKHDIYNAIGSGLVTGGILSIKSGPGGVLFGAVSFGIFSGVMEMVIEHFY